LLVTARKTTRAAPLAFRFRVAPIGEQNAYNEDREIALFLVTLFSATGRGGGATGDAGPTFTVDGCAMAILAAFRE
jgi:hypothetical protein